MPIFCNITTIWYAEGILMYRSTGVIQVREIMPERKGWLMFVLSGRRIDAERHAWHSHAEHGEREKINIYNTESLK